MKQCWNGHFYPDDHGPLCPYCPVIPVTLLDDLELSEPQCRRTYLQIEKPAPDCFYPNGLECDGQRLFGRKTLMEKLTLRLQDPANAVLIAGYRGVGKTSLVLAAINQLRRREPAVHFLQIDMNISRPVPIDDVLYQIITGLDDALREAGLRERLTSEIAARLDEAIRRTNFILTQRQQAETMASHGAAASGAAAKLDFSIQNKQSRAMEMTSLPYGQARMERDIVAIFRSIASGTAFRSPAGWTRFLRRAEHPTRIIVMIDELDKLEDIADGDGLPYFRALLREMKPILTASRANFVFLGGHGSFRDSEDDTRRGEGIYQSVFSMIEYLPTVRGLGSHLIARHTTREEGAGLDLNDFGAYLEFRGRGIPRLTWNAMYDFRCSGSGAATLTLEFDSRHVRALRCIASLEKILLGLPRAIAFVREGREAPDTSDQDHMLVRHACEWILDRGLQPFTRAALFHACSEFRAIRARDDATIQSILLILVRKLAENDFIEPVSDPAKLVMRPGDFAQVAQWRTVHRRLIELGRPCDPEPSIAVLDGRYALTAPRICDATSVFFDARDRTNDARVWVQRLGVGTEAKPAKDTLLAQWGLLQRFSSQAVAGVINAVLDGDEPYLIRAYTEVLPLEQLWPLLARDIPSTANAIGQALLAALEPVHNAGLLWLDFRPDRLMMDPFNALTLLDSGSIRPFPGNGAETPLPAPDCLREPGVPEAVTGAGLDIRTEIFAIGVLLYFIGTGRHWSSAQHGAPRLEGEKRSYPELARTSALLATIVARCHSENPDERYQTLDELGAALSLLAASVPAPTDAKGRQRTISAMPDVSAAFASGSTGSDTCAASVSDVSSLAGPTAGLKPHQPETVWPSSEPMNTGVKGERPFLQVSVAYVDTTAPFLFFLKKVTAGRAETNDLVLADIEVSRFAMSFEYKEQGWSVRELNTANGVFVDGSPVVNSSVSIRQGTEIRIGRTLITVVELGPEK